MHPIPWVHGMTLGELAHRHAFQSLGIRERDTRADDLADAQSFTPLPVLGLLGGIDFPQPPHPLGRGVRIGVHHFLSSSLLAVAPGTGLRRLRHMRTVYSRSTCTAYTCWSHERARA